MYKIILFILLSINSSFLTAQTFEPFVIIDPPHPMVGDTIRVGVAHTFHPPCLSLPDTNFQGLTHIFEITNKSILLTAINNFLIPPICFPFPVSPAPRAYYTLGELEEGVYSLDTQISGTTTFLPIPIPNPPGLNPITYGQKLTFTVSTPQIIDTLSFNQLVLLVFLLILLTFIGVNFKFIHLKYS